MEEWESKLRKKLNHSLPEGMYQIGEDGDEYIAHTGKGGQIDFEVEVERSLREESQKIKDKLEETWAESGILDGLDPFSGSSLTSITELYTSDAQHLLNYETSGKCSKCKGSGCRICSN